MQEVLQDVQASRLPAKEKALFAFLQKVNHDAHEIKAADLESLRRLGWTDEALYDAITVCALFNFYNRWNDATGVHGLTPEEFEASGKRLAMFGYVVE